jgi:hypothetical protein
MEDEEYCLIHDLRYKSRGPLYTADMIYAGNRAVLLGDTDGNEIVHTHREWKSALWFQHQNITREMATAIIQAIKMTLPEEEPIVTLV